MKTMSARLVHPYGSGTPLLCIVFGNKLKSRFIVTKRQGYEVIESFFGIFLNATQVRVLKRKIQESELREKDRGLETVIFLLEIRMNAMDRGLALDSDDDEGDEWKHS
jgi:hypothetical protein